MNVTRYGIVLVATAFALLIVGWSLYRIILVVLLLYLLIVPIEQALIKSSIILIMAMSIFAYLINRAVIGEQLAIIAFLLLGVFFIKDLLLLSDHDQEK